jgi:hypothetical protein
VADEDKWPNRPSTLSDETNVARTPDALEQERATGARSVAIHSLLFISPGRRGGSGWTPSDFVLLTDL